VIGEDIGGVTASGKYFSVSAGMRRFLLFLLFLETKLNRMF
jgi:hypothetical protein